MNYLLSIIVPVYNTENLLPRCIASVLNQDYQDWELILINDGSTDRSLEVCQSYADRDSRIRVFSQVNLGQSVARNVGLDHAMGRFVTFLDSDDSVEPETYQATIDAFKSNVSLDIIQFPVNRITSYGITYEPRYSEIFCAKQEIWREWLNERISWISCDKVYRRYLFDGIRFQPGILLEDNLIICQLVNKAKAIGLISQGGYNYIQTEYTEEKLRWSEDRTRYTIVSRVGMMEILASLYPDVRESRVLFYVKFTNAVWSALIGSKDKKAIIDMSSHGIKKMKMREAFCSNLSFKMKAKITLLMLCSSLSSWRVFQKA